jgi:hypothetical protein
MHAARGSCRAATQLVVYRGASRHTTCWTPPPDCRLNQVAELARHFPEAWNELLLAVAQFEADRVLNDQQPHLGRLDSWES